MPRIELSYGPPGQRGVTTLMAVGDTDYDDGLERAARIGTYAAGVAWILGAVLGSSTIKNMAAGAGVALIGVRVVSRSPRPAQTARATAGWR